MGGGGVCDGGRCHLACSDEADVALPETPTLSEANPHSSTLTVVAAFLGVSH